jgi:hypothetical protein
VNSINRWTILDKHYCSIVYERSKLLWNLPTGSPVLPCGNAAIKSEAIINLCDEWGMKNTKKETIPVCMGFDTTSTNTGNPSIVMNFLSKFTKNTPR